ncbi:hypothetical protein CNEO4_630123 [Clostridium neonatale]|nr:hypothetical protein CNEO4_630123 [Clostridium neonatale]
MGSHLYSGHFIFIKIFIQINFLKETHYSHSFIGVSSSSQMQDLGSHSNSGNFTMSKIFMQLFYFKL